MKKKKGKGKGERRGKREREFYLMDIIHSEKGAGETVEISLRENLFGDLETERSLEFFAGHWFGRESCLVGFGLGVVEGLLLLEVWVWGSGW